MPRRPLAVDVARYAGEWVVAVVADTRAIAEDAAELVNIEYEPLPFVLDGEEAYRPGSTLVHEAHGSNVLLDRTFVWGEVDKDFADSPHHLSLKVKWGRSSTVPIETFAVTANYDPWREILDVWASIQMPRFPEQIGAGAQAARARRCGCITTSMSAAATASSAASSTPCWSAIWRGGSASRCG